MPDNQIWIVGATVVTVLPVAVPVLYGGTTFDLARSLGTGRKLIVLGASGARAVDHGTTGLCNGGLCNGGLCNGGEQPRRGVDHDGPAR